MDQAFLHTGTFLSFIEIFVRKRFRQDHEGEEMTQEQDSEISMSINGFNRGKTQNEVMLPPLSNNEQLQPLSDTRIL